MSLNPRDCYKQEDWQRANNYQAELINMIKQAIPGIDIRINGFGANHVKRLYHKNPNPGEPDLAIWHNGKIVCYLEVQQTRRSINELGTLDLGEHKLNHQKAHPIAKFYCSNMNGIWHFAHGQLALKYENKKRPIARHGYITYFIQIPKYELDTFESIVYQLKSLLR